MRPYVKAALRASWPDETTVQLGGDPEHAVVLTGVGPGGRTVLELLDGQRTEEEVRAAAAAAGVPPGHTSVVLGALLRAGALDDADAPDPCSDAPWPQRVQLSGELAELALRLPQPGAAAAALRHRRSATVSLRGAGRVGAPLAALLTAGGVGTVAVADPGLTRLQDVVPGGLQVSDVGRPREEALARQVPGARRRRRSDDDGGEALAVLAPPAASDVALAERLRSGGVPHLFVAAGDGSGVVGPLVEPGVSACARCLALHRADRRPRPGLPLAPDPDVAGGALVLLTAALAALQVLAFLDAPRTGVAPPTLDGTLELRPPDWRIRRRSWTPHPDCGCTG